MLSRAKIDMTPRLVICKKLSNLCNRGRKYIYTLFTLIISSLKVLRSRSVFIGRARSVSGLFRYICCYLLYYIKWVLGRWVDVDRRTHIIVWRRTVWMSPCSV